MAELEWIERTLLAAGLISPGRLAMWLHGWQRDGSLLRHLVARGVLDSTAARTIAAVIQGYVQMTPEAVVRLFRATDGDVTADMPEEPGPARERASEPPPRHAPPAARVATRRLDVSRDMSSGTLAAPAPLPASASAPTIPETSLAGASVATIPESPPRRRADVTPERPTPESPRRRADVPPERPAPESPARRHVHVPSNRQVPSASSPALRAAVDLALSSSGGERPLWPAVGERFAGYQLQRLLRSGPGYAMYHGRNDERRVVIKLLRAGEAAVQRAAYARLDHPAIVPLLAAGSSEGLGYLAFADDAGIGLDEYVRVTGPLEAARVVRIGVAAAEALAAASRVGVVHGDLGPERLLVYSSDARVELIDFMAPIADDPGAHAVHRAPEQRAGGPASPRADMYSLGVALHLAATGRLPVGLGLRAPLPGLPHALSGVIGLLLQPQPERRPASWAHVTAALLATRPRTPIENQAFGTGDEDTP